MSGYCYYLIWKKTADSLLYVKSVYKRRCAVSGKGQEKLNFILCIVLQSKIYKTSNHGEFGHLGLIGVKEHYSLADTHVVSTQFNK